MKQRIVLGEGFQAIVTLITVWCDGYQVYPDVSSLPVFELLEMLCRKLQQLTGWGVKSGGSVQNQDASFLTKPHLHNVWNMLNFANKKGLRGFGPGRKTAFSQWKLWPYCGKFVSLLAWSYQIEWVSRSSCTCNFYKWLTAWNRRVWERKGKGKRGKGSG